MKNKKVKIISIISTIALALTLVTATFAYFMAQTGEGKSTDIKINANTVDTFTFATGDAISLNINQDNFASGAGNQVGTTFAKAMLTANNKTNRTTEHYYMYLSVSENTFTYTQSEDIPEILLTVKDASGNEITSISGLTYKTVTDVKNASISGFDITTKNGIITLFDNREITTTSSKTEQWNITVTFVNYNVDQTANAGNNFVARLLIQKNKITSVSDYIISQYTGTQGENNIYYHDGTLANGIADNSYRYAGASDSVNNYICLELDTNKCPVSKLYRIIGVFENRVKVIYSSIQKWDSWSDRGIQNYWELSKINTYLNGEFLEELGTSTDKIALVKWIVGGNSFENAYLTTPNVAYQNEIVNSYNSLTYEAKIGLMYISDYYFAASPEAWTLVGYNDDTSKSYSAMTSKNWLYKGAEWTISRDTSSERVHSIFGNGSVYHVPTYEELNYRAAFYLNYDVAYVSGDGSASNPIIIK